MHTLKYIGQTLAALIYTPIYMYLIYLLIYMAFGWIVTLEIGWMIFLALVFGGIAIGLFFIIQAFVLFPYYWIAYKNLTATFISVSLCVLFFIYDLYRLWDLFLEYHTRGGIAATIFSIILLIVVLNSVRTILGHCLGRSRECL